MTLGGLLALLTAWIVARRLVSPLRTLESAALQAASGAYVKPIDARREDEIGQVATAFNAVTLRLNALHDLTQLLASSSKLDQVLDGILSAMGHIVGPGVAAIYLLDEGGQMAGARCALAGPTSRSRRRSTRRATCGLPGRWTTPSPRRS